MEETDEKYWLGRTNIFSWPCFFWVYSTWMQTRLKILLNNTQKDVRITHFCWRNWKITRVGKGSPKDCCLVPRHGRTCSTMRWEILRTGKQKRQSSCTKFQALAWMIINSTRRCLNQLENYQNYARKWSWNAGTWHELVDLTFYGLWINQRDQSPNGHKHVTDD